MKFLNDAIHEEELASRSFNIVKAPPGCGKSWWALHVLPERLSDYKQMLYLIDTENGRDQLIRNNLMTMPYSEAWLNENL